MLLCIDPANVLPGDFVALAALTGARVYESEDEAWILGKRNIAITQVPESESISFLNTLVGQGTLCFLRESP